MKKTKKIFAIIGIVLLVSLYLSTLIFAFIDTTTSQIFLKVSVSATIFFPVMLYAMTLVYKLNGKNNRFSSENDETSSED